MAKQEHKFAGRIMHKRVTRWQTVEGDVAMQSAVSPPGPPNAIGTDVPEASAAAATAAADVAPQEPLAVGSSTVTQAVQGEAATQTTPTEPGKLTGPASAGVLQQMPSLQYIEDLILSVKQSPEASDAAAYHGTITVQMPRSVLDCGSFWLQAQCSNCISEPFAMPRYAVTVKEESVSRFQEHWRRYMYTPDTLRRVQ